MAQTRFFSSTAQPTTLTASISNTTTSIPLAATTGFPVQFPYTLALDYGNSLEELVDVSSVAGLNANVARAVDGTTAAGHSVGAPVRHVSSARDFNAANLHIGTSAGVHGITGNVVGDTDTQTLSNKTLSSPIVTNPTINGGTVNSASLVTVTGAGGASVPMIVNGPTGQTGDLEDWRVNNVTLSKITSTGAFNGPVVSLSGNATGTVPLQVAAANGTTVNIGMINTAQGTGVTWTSNGSMSLIAPGTGNTLNATAYVATSAVAPDSTNLFAVSNYAGNATLTLPNVNVGIGTASVLMQGPTQITSANSVTDAFTVNNTSASSTLLAKLQASGVNKFTVDANGNAVLSGNVVATGTLNGSNFTGGAWTSYSPTWGGSLTPGNGTTVANYAIAGKMVTVSIVFTAGTTTVLAATGGVTVTLPAAAVVRAGAHWHGTSVVIPNGSTTLIPASCDVVSGGATASPLAPSTTVPQAASINTTTLSTWNTSGIIRLMITYEVA